VTIIEPGYWDVEGRWHDAAADGIAAVKQALIAAAPAGPMPAVVWGEGPIVVALPHGAELATLTTEHGRVVHVPVAGTGEVTIDGPHEIGYHTVTVVDHDGTALLQQPVIVAPERVVGPEPGERVWGVFAPLYSITHETGGDPVYADLNVVGELVATFGGTVVGTLPLLATAPDDPSPYSPMSRLVWSDRYQQDRGTGTPGSELAAVAEAFRARGQRLYLDLPLGAHPGGLDTSGQPWLFAPNIAVGAPPDVFFDQGQNWGFPPTQPLDPASVWHFRDVVRHHMAVAGVLRIDHVMGLYRLYWVPSSATAKEGVYVRYPFEALLAVLCIESHRHDCWVVGEDLGTVPEEVRAAMHRHGLLGMWVAEFEVDSWWGGRPFTPPADAVACVDTHDTPPFATWLGEHDPLQEPVAVHADIMEALGRTEAAMVLVSLDDLWGETEPQNIPGTPASRPNWVHQFPVAIEQWADDPRVTEPLRRVDAARREGMSREGMSGGGHDA